ncbi:Panacea domain-containing protein [Desulfobacterales bacterium HSG17]|nr:Panacea domain-containing protein [Desulfobacterales bacterium HSG17]
MCEQLKDVMQSVLSRYDKWMYNSALTKFIYLMDIEAVRKFGKQITHIKWYRDNYGPFVWDVLNCAQEMPSIFEVHTEPGNKRRICLKNVEPVQDSGEIEILLDEIVNKIPNPKTDFPGFKEYVYATPPMILSRQNGLLDIVKAVFADQEVNEFSEALFNVPEWDKAFEYLAAN